MKIARRLLSVTLALLMIFALAACGESGTTGNTPGGNTPGGNTPGGNTPGGNTPGGSVGSDAADDFELPDRPVDEMTGKTYTIIQHDTIDELFGYSQDSQMGVLVTDRVFALEETYGCTLEFSFMPYDTSFPTALQAQMFSEGGGDIIFAHNNAMLRRALGTGGSESLVEDLLTVDHIINFWDFNKWGNITARECMMAGGTFYGVTPALWVDYTPLPYYQVVYNKDILASAELPDLQEYWEKEEWDRDTMVDVISSFDPSTDGIWGMTASLSHMAFATFITASNSIVNIDSIHADGSVEWSRAVETPDVTDALQWLKNTLTNYGKYFNNGEDNYTTWKAHEPFNEELCAMAVTRHVDIFNHVVTDGPENFGLITWAGYEANCLSGYYEQVATVSIPKFAQNKEHSAFLMYDLFEGLDGIETYDDVINYYRETYSNSDIDMLCLVREGSPLQYSYWPNDCTTMWSSISNDLLNSSSISTLIGKYAAKDDVAVEKYIVPNTVALEAYRQNGYFN